MPLRRGYYRHVPRFSSGRARKWGPCTFLDGQLAIVRPSVPRHAGLVQRGGLVTSRTLGREAVTGRRWTRDITGARTATVIADYVMLWNALQEIELQPGIEDKFIWKWSAAGTYYPATAYRAFFHGTTGLAGAREVWRACCPPKVKFFFWLALRKRLWTAERRWRHGL